MKKDAQILVLGGAGYIGDYIYNYLKNNLYTNVYKSGRRSVGMDQWYLSIDLSNTDRLNEILSSYNFDIIINTTGFVHVSTQDNNEMFDELIRGNVYTVKNLMQAISKNRLISTKIIHLSTMSVYGEAQYIPVDEEHPIHPVNLYGVTKFTGEQIVKYYSQNHNIPSLVLRVPGVFGGTRKTGAIYNFIKKAMFDEIINVNTTGLKSWSTIYIETLANMLMHLLSEYEWDQLYEVINISYEENIDIIETSNWIKQRLVSNSSVIVNQPIDYKTFFLSNRKLYKLIKRSYSYEADLDQFIKLTRFER